VSETVICFSTSRAWYSRVIRWATGAKVSHTFLLVYHAVLGVDMVLEASMLGFTMRPLESFLLAGNVIEEMVTPKVPVEGAVRDSLRWLDEFYDYGGLLGMAWVMLGRAFGRQWKNPLRNPRALFCSEAVTKVLQAAGHPGVAHLDPGSTSPEDLLEALRALR
jgi:hypothetical protein